MYAQINHQEITELATKKASGLATQIYLVLSSHCWKKNECFPSLSRIGEMLGNVYHTNSIHRALKWLEDNGFIIRKAAKATNRFVMKVRALTKKLVSKPNGEHKRERKRKNNYRYSNSYKNNKSKLSPEQRQRTPDEIAYDKAAIWLNDAMEYTFGITDHFTTKMEAKEIRRQLNGGNAASMFWKDIKEKCGHLMI